MLLVLSLPAKMEARMPMSSMSAIPVKYWIASILFYPTREYINFLLIFALMYSTIRKDVLKKIKPAQPQKKKAEKIALQEKERLSKLLGEEVVTGGSMAKGTWLRDNHDIDFFVVCEDPEELDAAKLSFAKRVKGSRDYYQYSIGGFEIEVVPVKKISSHEELENVTDASPLHVKYTSKKLNDQQKDDVRLAKQFCKANRIYGAESFIKGFSGHVLELLVAYYSSFHSLLKAAVSWEEPVIIDIEGQETYSSINKSKLRSPLVIIDPVQPSRNAVAALSRSSFITFKESAQKFLKRPSVAAFAKKPFRIPEDAIAIEFVALEGKRDTSGTKCLKAFEFVLKNIEEFGIKKSDFEYDHEKRLAKAYVVPEKKTLSKEYLHEGPPASHKGAQQFRKKHGDCFEKNNRLYTRKEREFTSITKKVTFLLKQENVSSRVESAKIRQ